MSNEQPPCRRCGKPARGYAKIGEARYCHSDEERPSCYELATWNGHYFDSVGVCIYCNACDDELCCDQKDPCPRTVLNQLKESGDRIAQEFRARRLAQIAGVDDRSIGGVPATGTER